MKSIIGLAVGLLASSAVTAKAEMLQCNLRHINGEIWWVIKYEKKGAARKFTLMSPKEKVMKDEWWVDIPETAVTRDTTFNVEYTAFATKTFSEALIVDWDKNFISRSHYNPFYSPEHRVQVTTAVDCIQLK